MMTTWIAPSGPAGWFGNILLRLDRSHLWTIGEHLRNRRGRVIGGQLVERQGVCRLDFAVGRQIQQLFEYIQRRVDLSLGIDQDW
jgi:hypothetical protein